MVFLVLQIGMVWLALAALYRAVPQRARHRGVIGQIVNKRVRVGGVLRYMFVYDTVCLVLVVGSMAVAQTATDQWQQRAGAYWAATMYGTAAAPYAVFKLPGVMKLLVTPFATGYDSEGHLRRAQLNRAIMR